MHSLTTRTLTTLLLAAPILAQGERPAAKPTAALGYVASTPQDPTSATPASLVEQALYAEEHERDFARAAELFQRALDAARKTNDAALLDRAQKGIDRVAARQRGAALEQDDPILCAIARCLGSMRTSVGAEDAGASAAETDIQLYGAVAVPWIEKAIVGPFELCDTTIAANVDRCVRALARMRIPEADAALQRLLRSIDPLARRAVASHCYTEAHLAILQQALADPTPSVREAAIRRFVRSNDPKFAATLLPHARAGNDDALEWLNRNDADALVTIATDAHADLETRARALDLVQRAKLPQTAANVDALLAIARESSAARLAELAMNALAVQVEKGWRPLDPSIAARIQKALTAAPGAYPQPGAALTLLGTGGGPAIAASALQLLAALDGLPERSNEPEQLARRVQTQLRQLGGDAFPYVVKAYLELPLQGSNGTARDQMLGAYQEAVQRLAGNAPSIELARSAVGIEGEKFVYYASVVASVLHDRFGRRARPDARLDPEWLPLLRRMADSTDDTVRSAAAIGLGALRDPSVLPELIALTKDRTGSVQERAREALRGVIVADPARARRVLEEAMSTFVQQNGKHPAELARELGLLSAADALELAERYWKESQDPQVRDALFRVVHECVDGEKGLEFLLRKLPDMAAASGYARMLAIQRFGNELYEPAIDALGDALKDPSSDVRDAARAAFAAFKAQREALAEFAAWKATTNEARATVDELVELLESPNVDVVVGAVKALGALKASAAYPKLVRLLERKEPAIKAAVQAALDKLGE
ncbi:MAG: HEAT repeat domain-containing protein [Planctomycetes bacterium]|nr:HEAT repeat domain-containing protein [Planctomycetota bacterium]